MHCKSMVFCFIIFLLLIFNFANAFLLPDIADKVTSKTELLEEPRKKKKKNKYFTGLILGAILCKLILFPLAVKAMAVMSSVSVLISALSLIMSSVVGYVKLATHSQPPVKLVQVKDIWAKGDTGYVQTEEDIPDFILNKDSKQF